MQHCDIMVENVTSRSQINLLNAASREKMLHRYVLFSAKKNICKDKIQKWLKLIWRWPELKQSETDLAQMILASLPRNKLFRSDSVSKLKSNFSSKISPTLISVLDPRSLRHLIASNYGGKDTLVVRGKSKIKYYKHLYWLQSYSEFKRKQVQLDNLFKRMWRSPQRNAGNYYAKCGWDTPICPHEFHVGVENKMSSNWNISSYFSFLIRETSGGENHMGKLFSLIEISSIPTKYLPCCYSLFFIICFIINSSMISAHWVALVYSPQCLSTIYVEYLLLPGHEKGNFLNGKISFSVRKSYFISPREITSTKKFRFPYVNKFLGNIHVKPGIWRVHLVCFQSR